MQKLWVNGRVFVFCRASVLQADSRKDCDEVTQRLLSTFEKRFEFFIL